MENLQLSRQHLRAIARSQPDPNLRHEKAFLMHLFGNATIVDVFEILISWLPYAKQKDGTIYKSDAELAVESGFSRKTVERARLALKGKVFEVTNRKANGAPTSHYRFDLAKFVQFVATKLNTTVEKIHEWISSISGQKDEMDSVNLTESPLSESRNGNRQNDEMDSVKLADSPSSKSRNGSRQKVENDVVKLAASLTERTTVLNSSMDNKQETTTASKLISPELLDTRSTREKTRCSDKYQFELNKLHSLLNVPASEVEGWIDEYGFHRVNNVARYGLSQQSLQNPGAWVRKALERGYELNKSWRMITHGLDYVTGPYADFILT